MCCAWKQVSQKTRLALKPADCLVIEDAPSVIKTVKAAGFPTLGVATSHDFEKLAEADWRVQTLNPAEVVKTDSEVEGGGLRDSFKIEARKQVPSLVGAVQERSRARAGRGWDIGVGRGSREAGIELGNGGMTGGRPAVPSSEQTGTRLHADSTQRIVDLLIVLIETVGVAQNLAGFLILGQLFQIQSPVRAERRNSRDRSARRGDSFPDALSASPR